jgi:LytS/YehU family sensor histidine kinase
MIEYQNLSQKNAIKYSQLEVLLIKSQLQELRSLIHPQFLFNTLQSISDLLDTNQNKKANQILSSLSIFLRKTVYDTERDEATLGEEIDFLRQYLEIERIRFSNKFEVHEFIEKEVTNAVVPNYFLQPIVGKYAVDALERGIDSYKLTMDIKKKNGDILVHIEDSGKGLHCRQLSDEGVLAMTKERLTLFFKTEQPMHFNSKPDGGIILEIQFPYHDKRIDSELSDGRETV